MVLVKYNSATGKWETIGANADMVDGLHACEIASNPNLADNPDFAINQKGETTYTATSSSVKFAVDRWRIQGAMQLTVGDGVTVKPTASMSGALTLMLQNIPWNLTGDDISVTLSAGGTTNAAAYFRVSALNASSASLKQSEALVVGSGKSVTLTGIPADTAILRVGLNFPAGSTASSECVLKWVKLEMGKNATPFCPPNPAVELEKCQRYYQIRSTNDIAAVDLRPTMRATPTDIKAVTGGYAYVAEF